MDGKLSRSIWALKNQCVCSIPCTATPRNLFTIIRHIEDICWRLKNSSNAKFLYISDFL